jgi:hypothetical protein
MCSCLIQNHLSHRIQKLSRRGDWDSFLVDSDSLGAEILVRGLELREKLVRELCGVEYQMIAIIHRCQEMNLRMIHWSVIINWGKVLAYLDAGLTFASLLCRSTTSLSHGNKNGYIIRVDGLSRVVPKVVCEGGPIFALAVFQ